MSTYDPDPSTVDFPLSSDEVAALIASGGKPLLRDQRRLDHFLRRTHATIGQLRGQIQTLHRDVQRILNDRAESGMATTLSPLDAVRYLTADQLEQLFGVVARQQLDWLKARHGDLVAAVRSVNAETARVKYACTTLLEDPTLAPEVRARFESLLRGAPDRKPEPAPLDLPADIPWATPPKVSR